MYKRKKTNNPIYKILIAILLFALITGSLLIQGNGNYKISLLKDLSSAINKVVSLPFSSLNKDKKGDQSKSYVIQKNVNTELQEEIKELKDLLELNKTMTEYETINSTILSRNKSYWFNTITIDKGTSSGIEENMAVVTKNGFVGKISKAYHNSSEVKLITSDDVNFKVSVAIRTNGVDHYAVMNGYNHEKNQMIVKGIDKTTEINKGDIVLTSGLGEMFPAGIYIGEVEEVESDKYNLSKIIYIKTKQNFNDMHYVTVLKVKS